MWWPPDSTFQTLEVPVVTGGFALSSARQTAAVRLSARTERTGMQRIVFTGSSLLSRNERNRKAGVVEFGTLEIRPLPDGGTVLHGVRRVEQDSITFL